MIHVSGSVTSSALAVFRLLAPSFSRFGLVLAAEVLSRDALQDFE
jgi:hypothetical protein